MEFRIENMTCGGCARSVTKAIQSVDANARVDADPTTRMVNVDTVAAKASLQKVLEEAGYPVSAN